MTLTRTTAALAFGIGLSFASGPLALAVGAGCPQRSDQEQYRNPPFFAEKAGQQQVGRNTGEAQKADQDQSGTQVASNCR